MASGRSPSYRPYKQPASPRFDSASLNMPAQQQRLRPSRHSSDARSGAPPPGSLRLPGLPRFHPANFPSSNSSLQSTPTTGVNSPQPPMSPRTQNRQMSEAQRALSNFQREFMNQQIASGALGHSHRRQISGSRQNPTSPRLVPMAGSPGPVTPLELEAESYLTVGSGATTHIERTEYVDRVIREQVERMRSGSASPGLVASNPSSPIGTY